MDAAIGDGAGDPGLPLDADRQTTGQDVLYSHGQGQRERQQQRGRSGDAHGVLTRCSGVRFPPAPLMLENKHLARLERAISGALRATIRDHGPITAEQIGSAAKRVLGQTLRHSPKTRAGDALPVLVLGLRCHCARCDYQWTVYPRNGQQPKRPVTCSSCGARNWWAAVGELPRGRPPAEKPLTGGGTKA